MNIYVVRHGQNEDNANGILNGRRDLPLTDIGRAQAHEIAEKIRDSNLTFDVVLSSPLSRALDTATEISKVNDLPQPIVTPELIERNFGSMTGVDQTRVEELCAPDILATNTITYFLSPQGAETFPDLLIRAHEFLDKLRTRYSKTDNILLVTHGDFGKMIYASYYGLNWRDVLTDFHFGNSDMLLLSPDSSPDDMHIFTITQHNN